MGRNPPVGQFKESLLLIIFPFSPLVLWKIKTRSSEECKPSQSRTKGEGEIWCDLSLQPQSHKVVNKNKSECLTTSDKQEKQGGGKAPFKLPLSRCDQISSENTELNLVQLSTEIAVHGVTKAPSFWRLVEIFTGALKSCTDERFIRIWMDAWMKIT